MFDNRLELNHTRWCASCSDEYFRTINGPYPVN